jgi:hypothetical protein
MTEGHTEQAAGASEREMKAADLLVHLHAVLIVSFRRATKFPLGNFECRLANQIHDGIHGLGICTAGQAVGALVLGIALGLGAGIEGFVTGLLSAAHCAVANVVYIAARGQFVIDKFVGDDVGFNGCLATAAIEGRRLELLQRSAIGARQRFCRVGHSRQRHGTEAHANKEELDQERHREFCFGF